MAVKRLFRFFPWKTPGRWRKSSRNRFFLAGERQSLRLKVGELGNSPFDYAAEVVNGRVVVATTSNGTVAIKSTDGAYRTLIGSFLNASAVCEAAQAGKDVLVVCAGTDGLFSLKIFMRRPAVAAFSPIAAEGVVSTGCKLERP